MAELPDSNI